MFLLNMASPLKSNQSIIKNSGGWSKQAEPSLNGEVKTLLKKLEQRKAAIDPVLTVGGN